MSAAHDLSAHRSNAAFAGSGLRLARRADALLGLELLERDPALEPGHVHLLDLLGQLPEELREAPDVPLPESRVIIVTDQLRPAGSAGGGASPEGVEDPFALGAEPKGTPR